MAATIPEQARPRGDLGNVVNATTPCRGWCPPMCRLFPVIRESDGLTKRLFSWHGPGKLKQNMFDFRCMCSCLGYHALLREHMQCGNYPAHLPETHRGVLTSTSCAMPVRNSLRSLGQDVHNAYDTGAGDYNIDEYCMILDSLPAEYPTPQDFLLGYLRSPNRMANASGKHKGFDLLSSFELKEAGCQNNKSYASAVPEAGDWYHIKIPGDNGDVMIVEVELGPKRCSATVQTMTDQEIPCLSDNHPVSGRRQFGIERLEGGSHRFYTRGFDRQTSVLKDFQASNVFQHTAFSSLMAAMAKEHGGRPERVGSKTGLGKWGWVRQIPVKIMISSIVVVKRTNSCWPMAPTCCSELLSGIINRCHQWPRRRCSCFR